MENQTSLSWCRPTTGLPGFLLGSVLSALFTDFVKNDGRAIKVQCKNAILNVPVWFG